MDKIKTYSKSEILQKITDFKKSNPNGVIEILGATASGKTDFSIEVAHHIRAAEIISVDSRQVYKYIDISSAKITKSEMQNIPHHGQGLICPNEDFSVYDFQQYAFRTIKQIQSRKNVPILCGGTMLWLDAISENYVFAENSNEKSTQKSPPLWPVLKIGIHWDRSVLYDRINQRTLKLFKHGMIEETKHILKKFKPTKSAFTSFGYQEIQDFLEKKTTYDEAIIKYQKRNRNYAKRQLTWWRDRSDIVWLDLKN